MCARLSVYIRMYMCIHMYVYLHIIYTGVAKAAHLVVLVLMANYVMGVGKCVAVCCSVLQCVAVCRSVLHCVAVCCSVSQCVVECRSVLFSWPSSS